MKAFRKILSCPEDERKRYLRNSIWWKVLDFSSSTSEAKEDEMTPGFAIYLRVAHYFEITYHKEIIMLHDSAITTIDLKRIKFQAYFGNNGDSQSPGSIADKADNGKLIFDLRDREFPSSISVNRIQSLTEMEISMAILNFGVFPRLHWKVAAGWRDRSNDRTDNSRTVNRRSISPHTHPPPPGREKKEACLSATSARYVRKTKRDGQVPSTRHNCDGTRKISTLAPSPPPAYKKPRRPISSPPPPRKKHDSHRMFHPAFLPCRGKER